MFLARTVVGRHLCLVVFNQGFSSCSLRVKSRGLSSPTFLSNRPWTYGMCSGDCLEGLI